MSNPTDGRISVTSRTFIEALARCLEIDSTQESAQIGPVDVAAVIDRMSTSLRALADAARVRLRTRPAEIIVRCDGAVLEAVLHALLIDAIANIGSGGYVRLYCVRRHGRLLLVVRTGCAQPWWPAGWGRPIDALWARHAAAPVRTLGSACVEHAGLRLQMNEVCGSGTRLILDMEERAGDDAHALTALSDGAFMVGLNVLVLEDNVALSQCLCGIIEAWGGTPLETHSAAELEQVCDTLARGPDVLIVDYWLEDGQSGLDAVRQLRRRFGDDTIPVVLISGDLDLRLSLAAIDRNSVFVDKPFSTSALRDALQGLLAGRCGVGAPALQ
ncbi:MAG: response regulator [Rhodocyclaceae bacterium]